MEEKLFIENIKEQFLEPEEVAISLNSEFKKLDSYDSLTAMSIMVMLKDEYGVSISDEEYRSMNLVRDLYDFVAAKR